MSVKIKVEKIGIETDRAICVYVQVPGAKAGIIEKFWFPLSQVDSIHRGAIDPYLIVSDWIAQQKGFA